MVKSSSSHSSSISNLEVRVTENNNNFSSSSSSSVKYKGVRKRKWGKYVSEIRLPNSRERIWLGSYDTAEKAARAFDAALYCLRGTNAKFNFPDNPPEIPNGRSMSPAQIQTAATQYAHSDPGSRASAMPGRVDSVFLDSQSDSLSSCELLQHVGSPCTSVSGGEFTDMPLDNAFLDHFSTFGTENNVPDYGVFPEFDDFPGNFMTPHLPSVDYWPDYNSEDLNSHSFNLWNF